MISLQVCVVCFVLLVPEGHSGELLKQTVKATDSSIEGYLTERTCWWNEICKEEFRSLFRCKCPEWSYCRAPGRYYNAFCSMANTGFIWLQPGLKVQPK
ncbi:uncharacterized protein LOC126742933 [Anthonomus grandis grandis]|uniref:uncharacterized protein LOC126742933 n=1 Tax=Anthonomus grandis grandis TaxID=2921223 RepID=UPI0021659412|nr:uncharacterized protein LOC126742933 [Anthonomus grandis grandis]